MAMARFLKRHGFEVLAVLPLSLYIFGFTLLPVLRTIRLGFTDSGTGGLTLAHYRELFGHGQFGQALTNTVVITLLGLTFELLAGLVLALILSRPFRGRGLFRAVLLVPMGVPTLVAGVTLLYIFDTSGYLNELLFRLHFIAQPIDWASGGLRTLLMVVFGDMWKVTPLVVLILLAGLEAIPESVYEAAAVDGATAWQTLTRITLPLLRPAITMALIIRAVDAFRIFELPLVLAGRYTPVLSTYAYSEYNYGNFNTSGAASTILLAIILIFVVGYFFLVERGRGDVL
ncbi:MAG: carbohydrate ABC transporter permease [Symbiobacteriia bacterium]